MPSSRWVPGRYPSAGTSPIADAIRDRRGARGLTPLDGTLLHLPAVASGWNELLGAVRTKGKLDGGIREAMILRVAALNKAAYEWIHHEGVGRKAGLNTAQLRVIRDTSASFSGSTPSQSVLSRLHIAALAFTDDSTKNVQVRPEVTRELVLALKELASQQADVDDLLVECATVIATYNMVSRFLMSLDVAGASDELVPWPVDKKEHTIPVDEGTTIHAITLRAHESAPWIVLCNSLLTNHTMWDPILPYLLSPQGNYNVIVYDQRGHGKSSTPASGERCTMELLAKDISTILQHLSIPTPIHSVIGVSQGGATALAFSTLFPKLTKSVVACDTGPRTPAGNKAAWEERIALGKSSDEGMAELADQTLGRWFPPGSKCNPGVGPEGRRGRIQSVKEMIEQTSVAGFEYAAASLMEYDLGPSLFESQVSTLLLAGSLDGNGKVAEGLRTLHQQWNRPETVKLEIIDGAGHLPMIDESEKWWEVVSDFLKTVV